MCRIPEDVIRSWADSFEKVMSSEGKIHILSVIPVLTVIVAIVGKNVPNNTQLSSCVTLPRHTILPLRQCVLYSVWLVFDRLITTLSAWLLVKKR